VNRRFRRSSAPRTAYASAVHMSRTDNGCDCCDSEMRTRVRHVTRKRNMEGESVAARQRKERRRGASGRPEAGTDPGRLWPGKERPGRAPEGTGSAARRAAGKRGVRSLARAYTRIGGAAPPAPHQPPAGLVQAHAAALRRQVRDGETEAGGCPAVRRDVSVRSRTRTRIGAAAPSAAHTGAVHPCTWPAATHAVTDRTVVHTGGVDTWALAYKGCRRHPHVAVDMEPDDVARAECPPRLLALGPCCGP